MDRSNEGGGCSVQLEDIPDVLSGMAELTACNAGTEVELTNGDAVVLDAVGEVVVALGHGTDENGNTLTLVEASDVITDTYDLGVETERDLAAIRREVIGDGVLDDFDELLLRRCRADLMSVQQLHHESGESLEGTRDADCRADPDEYVLGGVDVDLKLARLVDWRVE